MKHLKSFKIFEEIDTDSGTDNKMRQFSPKMVEYAKKYEQLLAKAGVKLISKNVHSNDESRKLRAEAIQKIQSGDEKAYGIMEWSDDICKSFQIITPEKGFEVVGAPKTAYHVYINFKEGDKFASLEIYNSPNESKSLYMKRDGEVLLQWNDYENEIKGTLSNKVGNL